MTTRRRYSKQRHEDRFTKSLSDARDMLDNVIEKAQDGDTGAFDELEKFSRRMDRIYRQAERIEDDD